MEPASMASTAAKLAVASLEPVDVLIFITVVLVLFLIGITWRAFSTLERGARQRRTR